MRGGSRAWQGHERGSVEVHDATDEAGPLPKPRCPLLVVVWGPNAAQAQVSTQLMAHRGELRPPVEGFAQEAGSIFMLRNTIPDSKSMIKPPTSIKMQVKSNEIHEIHISNSIKAIQIHLETQCFLASPTHPR